MIIDHDPGEAPRKRSWYWSKGVYWIAWIMVGLMWLGEWHTGQLSWRTVLLAFGSGMVLAAWAIEITDNAPPSSWGRKPPR